MTAPVDLTEAAVLKDGLPRRSYAYAPTADPGSWRLPFLKPDGAPDESRLGSAASALAEGAVPIAAEPAVKAKLRQAYKRAGTPLDSMPAAVREEGALVEAAYDSLAEANTAAAEMDDVDDEALSMALAMQAMELRALEVAP